MFNKKKKIYYIEQKIQKQVVFHFYLKNNVKNKWVKELNRF